MQLQSMFFPRALGRAAILLFPLAAIGAPADPFPPPGLYRVDTDATTQHKAGTTRLVQDGATSAGVLHAKGVGKAATSLALPGSAPATLCMAARPANGGLPLPSSSCRGGPGVAGPDGTTFTMACGFLDMTTVVRKLDPKTWEYRVTSIEHGAAGMGQMPDFATQKAIFVATAKDGATAEERADAAETLKNWPAYEAEMRSNLSAEDRGSAKQVVRKTTALTRLTRIADTCAAR